MYLAQLHGARLNDLLAVLLQLTAVGEAVAAGVGVVRDLDLLLDVRHLVVRVGSDVGIDWLGGHGRESWVSN